MLETFILAECIIDDKSFDLNKIDQRISKWYDLWLLYHGKASLASLSLMLLVIRTAHGTFICW